MNNPLLTTSRSSRSQDSIAYLRKDNFHAKISKFAIRVNRERTPCRIGHGQTNEQEIGTYALPGIGKLFLYERKAGMGRNPATGYAIKNLTPALVKMRMAKAA
jgi:hypothetical protein